MARIEILPPQVVNQIAAGEVIERPASVVKELVENALDAGARRIEVRVADGGTSLVEVADDGWGMDAGDLARAFLPHATSKVRSVEDLLHVSSLGFRGEALASIGSVARATIVSRTPEAATALRIENREGVLGPVEPAAGNPGTLVRVEGLFARVPARRKFLRAPGTELGHVAGTMARFAVAFPDVRFRLAQGARVLLETGPAPPGPEGGAERRDRLCVVHGDEIGRALLAAQDWEGDLALEAWVGPPALHRADGALEQVFLNGRFVRDRTVAHAVREAYRGLLPPGQRRPVAFLFLDCPPDSVDVNVHPAKAEVRWRESRGVHRLVERALRRVLEGASPGSRIPLERLHPRPSTVAAVEFAFTQGTGRPVGGGAPRAATSRAGPSTVCEEDVPFVAGEVASASPSPLPRIPEPRLPAPPIPAPPSPGPPSPGPPSPGPQAPDLQAPGELPAPAAAHPAADLRVLGQALGTYLVFEGADSIVLVDQHALHERILVDRIAERLREDGRLEVQRLLVPAIVRLDPADAACVEEHRGLLETLGWHVEAFGDADVAVHGVPAVLVRPDPERALRDVLSLLEEGGEHVDRTTLLDDAIHRMACRAAVMAGDRLHPEEARSLLEQAEACVHSHTCPHGRPTRLVLERKDLERWFHRTA